MPAWYMIYARMRPENSFSLVLFFSLVMLKVTKIKVFFLVWKFINRLLFKIRCYVFVYEDILPTTEEFTREEISQMWENFGIWFRELANFYPHKSTKKQSPNSRNEILRKYLLAKLSTSLKWEVFFLLKGFILYSWDGKRKLYFT